MRSDLRHALRLMLRTPGFTVVAVLTLALGIGATTAVFTVVDGVLLRPAPVADLDRLAVVWQTDRNSGTMREPASFPDYLDFQSLSRSFGTMGALMAAETNLAPPGGEPVRLASLRVSHEFLPMLGFQPVTGRHFTEEEDRPNGPNVAMISESLWASSFGRDPEILGRTLRLDEVPFEIVAVVQDSADFGVLQVLSAAAYSRSFADRGARVEVDVWLPMQADPAIFVRDTHPLFILGRLAPGVSVAAAQDELAPIAAELEREYPSNDGRGVHVEALEEVVFGPVRPALWVLLGAVSLVLLVACVNVANLLLARGAARAKEVAVRSALGARTGRLARQFLIETLALTLIAAVTGTVMAFVGLQALLAMAPPDVPRLAAVTIDFRVLAVTSCVSLLAGLIFGMVPTLQARRIDLQSALKGEGGPGLSAGPTRSRVRAALVVAELSLAVVLLAGAGLLIRSFWHLSRVDPGFDPAGVVKAEFKLPGTRYPADFARWPNFEAMHRFNDELLRKAAALPGVGSAAVAGNHPMDPGFTNSFSVVGREAEARNWPEICIRRVSADYFRTVGLRLLRGRVFRDSDGTFEAPVILINEAAARRFFHDRNPLGEKIRLWGAARSIVGVVGNEKFQGLAEAAPLAAYLPLAQAPSVNGAHVLLVLSSSGTTSQGAAMREVVRSIDRELAVYGVEPLNAAVSRNISRRTFTMVILAVFAVAALVLAAVGVHGVLSYSVAQRTQEIGIRMALGARGSAILGLIVAHALLLISIGLAIGIVGALLFTRLLASLLFGVTPADPLTLAAVVLFLGCAGIVAAVVPALRAVRVHPASALRSE